MASKFKKKKIPSKERTLILIILVLLLAMVYLMGMNNTLYLGKYFLKPSPTPTPTLTLTPTPTLIPTATPTAPPAPAPKAVDYKTQQRKPGFRETYLNNCGMGALFCSCMYNYLASSLTDYEIALATVNRTVEYTTAVIYCNKLLTNPLP